MTLERDNQSLNGAWKQSDLSEKPQQSSALRNFAQNTISPTTSVNSRNREEFESMQIEKSRQFSWWQAWQFWGIVLVLISGGIGFTATSLLLKLPKTQTCSKVFWPVASASVRLYCAQIAAEEQTVDNLLQAIALVRVLPASHPLRAEIDRNVEKWTTDILAIAEEKFQQGELKTAEQIAQKIPSQFKARQLAEDKISQWNAIWQAAEQNYAEVEKQLRDSNWNQAFSWAVKLTDINNQYWATTKYQEAINKINVAQEERSTLDRAYDQFRRGGLDNILAALEKVEAIETSSYAYQDAQDLRADAKNQLLKYIDQSIDQEKWQEILQVTSRIPKSLKLEKQIEDWNLLAGAGSSASLDTVFGLEEGILELQNLKPNSPLYQRGQKLISRWKLEIEAVKHLEEAKNLALGGQIKDYNAAIAEASLVASTNPRYQQAQQQINSWRREIRIIEDQPVLDRANQLAIGSNLSAWKQAIAEASLITSNSPLYSEAQRNIQNWQANIEREEDRPFLDQALTLAGTRNYSEAIRAAERIRPGRALYQQAQEKVALWRQEIQADNYLREAYDLADIGTPEALVKAINLAQQVSSATNAYSQTQQIINGWANQILDLAYTKSSYALEEAIAIAQTIPSGTVAYSEAQSQIKNWQERLRPPVIERELPLREINLDKPRSRKFNQFEDR
ncbi:hypothetical protein Sta7437_2090 [Stanieria cyanosphaera PCC 7437]|uniref:Chromosome segregation ATPase n=1 Tax=Stanieria cyanosphaera (strain ATCC 29371 / PCC 7437) TaxID=111780 RepID=K9XU88_STAC7|nr:hypothetical protein [Stanieria cyanosphaera]AFZ35641.1 hypothetical protein Sta7437_2090 [Stanieria cyanosphaera PCC 7437]